MTAELAENGRDVLQAPFPWFGGKSRAAGLIWERLGDVPNYVEPFFGSGAVLLGRPFEPGVETVNDKDGFIANFWRAVTADPERVAHYADWPVNENDLHARHVWLVQGRGDLERTLEGDPDYYDAKVAGWWVWGICCWIGSGWCSGQGPWYVQDGQLVRAAPDGRGIWRQLPHLSSAGMGVVRRFPYLSSAGMGVHRPSAASSLSEWFQALAKRMRRVRVCCGDWTRILGPSPTVKLGLTGILLDPPYDVTDRNTRLYTHDETGLAEQVRMWAIEHGSEPLLRIALCGYEGMTMPDDWTCVVWKAKGGYASQGHGSNRNAWRERVWFSPGCLRPDCSRQLDLEWEA